MNALGANVSINDGEIPSVFLCPITDDIMRTPVVARDGFTYDESALLKWVRQSATSPLTRKSIEEYDWTIDRSLAYRIDKWMVENPNYYPAADLPPIAVVSTKADNEIPTENDIPFTALLVLFLLLLWLELDWYVQSFGATKK